jgi:hypothetical protein
MGIENTAGTHSPFGIMKLQARRELRAIPSPRSFWPTGFSRTGARSTEWLLAIVGQLGGETDAAARRVSWLHEFADCREDRGDGFVMLRELAIQA